MRITAQFTNADIQYFMQRMFLVGATQVQCSFSIQLLARFAGI